MMELANNWKITIDNKFWFVVSDEKQNIKIVFSKLSKYYRIEPVDVFEEDEEVLFFINREEHQMINRIVENLWGGTDDESINLDRR